MNCDLSQATALVIDDDMVVAWGIEEILRDIGFGTVIVAGSDHSAAQAARTGTPDLIVCDLDLGDTSKHGLELLSDLDPEQVVPTVLYTGYAGERTLRRVAQVRPGATVLPKPASDAALTATIMRSLTA
jgi:CheY-like chemotaxis protein